MTNISNLTEKQKEVLEQLPATRKEISDNLNISIRSVRYRMDKIEESTDIDFERTSEGIWKESNSEMKSEEEEFVKELNEEVKSEGKADINELTTREEYIAGELETGSTLGELANELGIRVSVLKENIKEIKRRGWEIYHDKTADRVAIESDSPIRSSEHKGTRTRKANKWWELNNNKLVREFRGLDEPGTTLSYNDCNEDWVTHLTDLHAGDIVRTDDKEVLYETDMIPSVINYVTDKSISLSEKHGSEYDTAHLLWGGDFVTNEGIYEGQFEDLDAWLDEQHDILVDPLIKQIHEFSKEFDTVQVVCQVGNHGQNRASGTSRQANADLILYKTIRNTVSKIQEFSDELKNVKMIIGEAKAYRNFTMRGGEIKGHLRHGQNRKPQAETSARENQWRGTLLDHDFNIAYMGHYHISGMIPWDGPPVISSSSPKPAGEFVERLGGRVGKQYQDVATVHGVSDEGITGVFPVDMRDFEREELDN